MAFFRSGVSYMVLAFFRFWEATTSFRLYLAALADLTAVRTCVCCCSGRRKVGSIVVVVERVWDLAAREREERHEGQYRAAEAILTLDR